MLYAVKSADQLCRRSNSRELQAAQWDEPEFEFDDIGIDLEAAAARHDSGKVTLSYQREVSK